jgi:hypothetical protein
MGLADTAEAVHGHGRPATQATLDLIQLALTAGERGQPGLDVKYRGLPARTGDAARRGGWGAGETTGAGADGTGDADRLQQPVPGCGLVEAMQVSAADRG